LPKRCHQPRWRSSQPTGEPTQLLRSNGDFPTSRLVTRHLARR